MLVDIFFFFSEMIQLAILFFFFFFFSDFKNLTVLRMTSYLLRIINILNKTIVLYLYTFKKLLALLATTSSLQGNMRVMNIKRWEDVTNDHSH